MNTDTGALYRTAQAVADAERRGEPLAMVSERVARAVRIGTRFIDRKAVQQATRKRKRQMAKQSRRTNRRR